MTKIFLSLVFAISIPAQASNWCAANDYLENCWYYSLSSCKEAIKDKDSNWYCFKKK